MGACMHASASVCERAVTCVCMCARTRLRVWMRTDVRAAEWVSDAEQNNQTLTC